jgi:hypothetical protein
LFSEEVVASAEALAANPQRAHQDLQRAMKVFMMPEILDLEEATSVVKKARYKSINVYNNLYMVFISLYSYVLHTHIGHQIFIIRVFRSYLYIYTYMLYMYMYTL